MNIQLFIPTKEWAQSLMLIGDDELYRVDLVSTDCSNMEKHSR